MRGTVALACGLVAVGKSARKSNLVPVGKSAHVSCRADEALGRERSRSHNAKNNFWEQETRRCVKKDCIKQKVTAYDLCKPCNPWKKELVGSHDWSVQFGGEFVKVKNTIFLYGGTLVRGGAF